MPKHQTSESRRAFARQLRTRMPNAEAVLWSAVRAGRLDGWKFKRQVPFGRYVADFCCAEARLIVELDGPLHDRPGDRLYDDARDAWFASQGFRVLRIPNDVVLMAGALAIERIKLALTAPSPCPPSAGCPSPSRGEG